MNRLAFGFFLSLALFFASVLQAQDKSGFKESALYVDKNGKVSDSFIDLDLTPVNPIVVSIDVGADFAPGKAYLSNGKVLDGLLKYNINGRKLLFKAKGSPSYVNATRIKPKQCLGFVILADTFTVISNFQVVKKESMFSMPDNDRKKLFKKSEFVEVLGTANDVSIYKFVDFVDKGINTYFLLHQADSIIDVSDENSSWRTDIKPLMMKSDYLKKSEDLDFRKMGYPINTRDFL